MRSRFRSSCWFSSWVLGMSLAPLVGQPVMPRPDLQRVQDLIAEHRARRSAWLLGKKGATDPRVEIAERMADFLDGTPGQRSLAACWLVDHDASVPPRFGYQALEYLSRNQPTVIDWSVLARRARYFGKRTLHEIVHRRIESTPDGADLFALDLRARLALELFGNRPGDLRRAQAVRDYAVNYALWMRDPEVRRVASADGTKLRVEVHRQRWSFEASLAAVLRRVDFEDVRCTPGSPSRFAEDRYAASHGIRIRGGDGQYADMSFGFPDEFVPTSGTNMYAPGPTAERTDAPGSGGHTTRITFTTRRTESAVSGFGCEFIDCDHPHVAKCRVRAWWGDVLLLDEDRIRSPDGHAVFRGLVVRNDAGQLVHAITRLEIVNGNQWPAVDGGGDGVALDDFTFSKVGPPLARGPKR